MDRKCFDRQWWFESATEGWVVRPHWHSAATGSNTLPSHAVDIIGRGRAVYGDVPAPTALMFGREIRSGSLEVHDGFTGIAGDDGRHLGRKQNQHCSGGFGVWVSRDGYATRFSLFPPFVFIMSHEEREDSGRFTETVTLEAVLGVFDAVVGPVVTSGDVAEALDCSGETARRKLRALEAEGRVASRKTAGRVVWWRVTEGESTGRIDSGDPFWTFEPGSSGESDVSERVDDIVYGRETP
jgi:hypothetical protein